MVVLQLIAMLTASLLTVGVGMIATAYLAVFITKIFDKY